MTLTAERLRELLDYDPETGVFRWKVRTSNRIKVGDVAGCARINREYVKIKIVGHKIGFYAHRLAWLYVYGEWPSGDVDHINGKKGDNSISNLRLADRSKNMQNLKIANKNSRTGLLGVHIDKKKFGASITLNYKRIYIGNFDTAEEAHQAYLEAKRRLHEGNTL